MNELQVLEDGEWKYVFCRNPQACASGVVTTQDRKKALRGKGALEYFQTKCANSEFRLTPLTTTKAQAIKRALGENACETCQDRLKHGKEDTFREAYCEYCPTHPD